MNLLLNTNVIPAKAGIHTERANRAKYESFAFAEDDVGEGAWFNIVDEQMDPRNKCGDDKMWRVGA